MAAEMRVFVVRPDLPGLDDFAIALCRSGLFDQDVIFDAILRRVACLVRCIVGVAVTPRIIAPGFRVVSDLGLGEGKQRCGVDVRRAGGFCDDGGAGVLDALAWQDVQARSDSFNGRLGEAAEEFLGRHVAEVSVGADGVASNPGRKAAIAMAERAGEDVGKRLARNDAQAFDVVAEASALGDRLNEFCAGRMPGTVVRAFKARMAPPASSRERRGDRYRALVLSV
jgi:hypothetical protein